MKSGLVWIFGYQPVDISNVLNYFPVHHKFVDKIVMFGSVHRTWNSIPEGRTCEATRWSDGFSKLANVWMPCDTKGKISKY